MQSHAAPARANRKRLGEILVDADLLSPAQLERALVEHRRRKQRLGQYLIDSKILSEDAILQAIAQQLRVDIYTPQKYHADPSLKALVPEEAARQHMVVPLQRSGRLLRVATTDPTDIFALDLVTEATRLDVEPVICTQAEFKTLVKALYDTEFHEPEADILHDYEMEMDDVEAQRDEDETTHHALSITAEAAAEEAPIVRLVNSVLLQALNRKASDIHLQPEKERVSLRLRLDGVLHEILAPPRSAYPALVSRLKLLSNMDISITRVPQDGRFTFRAQEREVSVRTSTFPTIHGEKVVMRLLDQSAKALSLDELGLHPGEMEKLREASHKSYGMVLATGPTGSGKTTLLYSLLAEVADPEINVITLEDPVEYQMPTVAQAQLNRRAGMTFASGLRSILRQDPDVIMVGEIRDAETANVAVEASLTGHRVFSTLHTNDAAGAVTRFVEMGVEPYLVASTLLAAVAQRLVRRICADCAESYEPNPEHVKALGARLKQGETRFHRGRGCAQCGDSGYKGRLGIYEVLRVDARVQDLILRNASSVEIARDAVARGSLRTLKMDAAVKVLSGKTTYEEFLRVAAT